MKTLLLTLILAVTVAGCVATPDDGTKPAPTTQQTDDAIAAGAGAASIASVVLLPPPFGELVAGLIGLTAGWYIRNRKGKTASTTTTSKSEG
jgi:hypothetical protein